MSSTRLTLVQRQQQLLEERGFSKPSGSAARRSADFAARQDAHATKTGRGNAAASSRKAADFLPDGAEGGAMDDGASIHSGVSHAPSMHPSLAGTVMSKACSEVTIGAGDNTGYWDYQHRSATRSDLGHNCRECRLPFNRVGEAITERRGARVSMRYHAECFSGFADPRSQATSSHHIGALAGMQLEAAPHRKAGGKMRAGQHFDSGSDSRFQQQESSRQSAGGKMAGLGMHSGGFGARSSKPREGAGAQVREPARAPGDLTEEALAEHLRVQSIQEDVES